MAESLGPTERLPDTDHTRRVNPADRSNPEKKDNGFSNALKEKMKEKLKEKARDNEEVIVDIDLDESSDTDEEETPTPEEQAEEPQAEDDDAPPTEHVDLKA